MLYANLGCLNCAAVCVVEYDETVMLEEEPVFCPFCGEEIESDLDDDEDDESSGGTYEDDQ